MASELDILEQEEANAYKARAVSAKFKQQIAYGVGAAMMFGVFSGLVATLMKLAVPAAEAGVGAIALTPALGLVGLAALGIGLLYLSARYLSENTLLDQQMQAKQISCAARGNAPQVEQTVTTPATKVEQFPAMAESIPDAAPEANAPTTTITAARELASTVTPRAETKAKETPEAKWTAQVEANDNAQLTSRAV